MEVKALHAFDAVPIHTAPDCSCLGVWGHSVLVGLNNGDLQILKPEEHAAALTAAGFTTQTRRGLTSGPVLQLQTDEARSMLFCMGKQGVRVYRLPRLLLKAEVAGTRGCRAFAWHSETRTLATAYRKRVYFFTYEGLEFVPSREVPLSDTVVCLAFVGAQLVVGLSGEYCCIAPAQSGVAHLAQHASASPCVTPVSASQVLLSLGAESGLFRLPDGPRPPHQTASLAWSSPPASVAVAAPFALGALGPDAVEARPIQALSGAALVQTLALKGEAGGAEPAGADAGKETSAASSGTSGPALLCPWPLADGSCLVARAGGRLVRLSQRPALAQAAALLELGEYEECLAVAAAAPAADLEARRRLEDVAHLRYAAVLFRAGEFEGSMLHFGASGAASTLALLRLLPSLASPGHLEALAAQAGEELGAPDASPAAEPQGEEFARAVAVVLPHLLSQRNREAGASPGGVPSPAAVAVDTAVLRALLALPDSGALLHFIQRPNHVDLEEGRAALRAAGRYSELVALYQGRGRHSSALALLESLSVRPEQLEVPAQGASAELRGLPGAWAAVRYLLGLGADQLSLISTHSRWILEADPDAGLQMFTSLPVDPGALLPILNSHAPALAGSYLEEVLASGRAAPAVYQQQLAALYLRHVVQHASEDPGDPEARGLAETAKLKQLILHASHLRLDSLLALLPSHQLLELRAAILERMGRHHEALRLYVHQLGQPAAAEAYCDRVYGRQVAAAAAARRKPSGGAPPEPASHIEALHLPMLRLWLDRTGQRQDGWSDPQPSDIYLLLIQVLLEARHGAGDGDGGDGDGGSGTAAPAQGQAPATGAVSLERWAEVAELLGRKRGAIQPVHALELLPRELPLRAGLRFLRSALWGAQEERRGAAVRRSLRQAEAVGLAAQLAGAHKRLIALVPERLCTLCYKRVGLSAFVAFPDGRLAHYSCFKRHDGRGSGAVEALKAAVQAA
uniref:CNH domain-containing protein n=1 Tax=Auxenochlorella protothecoides TaxID=3075 RepID=A0A1D1ZMX2_AUXPR